MVFCQSFDSLNSYNHIWTHLLMSKTGVCRVSSFSTFLHKSIFIIGKQQLNPHFKMFW